MQTSETGVKTLEQEEGVVLRAYRDIVGKWTIGAGLTAASGVITPKAGMVISNTQSAELTARALRRNYEPAVATAMPKALQHEFDAGVLFHWNTGAIKRASWVKQWRAKAARSLIADKFRLWNKAGGKVVHGLVLRRERELNILLDGLYPLHAKVKAASLNVARWTLPMSASEKAKAIADFTVLGYEVGSDSAAVSAPEIRRFQENHGLSVDAKIGRATLSTLQRMIDAKAKTKSTSVVAAGTAIPAGTSMSDVGREVSNAGIDPLWLWVPFAVATLWALWRVWQYRDALAARLHKPAPSIAKFLRSF